MGRSPRWKRRGRHGAKATAGENADLARLRGEVERLSTAIVEQAIELAALRGSGLGMSGPVPARVAAAAKTVLLDVIDDAVSAGWSLTRICGVLELDRPRAWRWQHRRCAGIQ